MGTATRDWDLRPEYLESPDNWVAIHVARMRDRGPETVLISSSIGGQLMYTGTSELDERAQLKDIYILHAMTTAVGEWYWMMRNMVVTLDPRPSLVAVMFVGDNLTVPLDMNPNAPPLTRAIQAFSARDAAPAAWSRRRTVPAYWLIQGVKRELCRHSSWCNANPDGTIISALRDAQVRQIYKLAPAPRDAAAATLAEDERDAATIVAAMVARSYLPLLIDVARQYGIPLLFIRSKERCVYLETGCLEYMREISASDYFDGVRRYIESRGATYVDLSTDPRLGLDDFGDGVHIKIARMSVLAEMVRETVARELDRLSAAESRGLDPLRR